MTHFGLRAETAAVVLLGVLIFLQAPASHALQVGDTCKLDSQATLFSALEGPEMVRKITAGEELVLKADHDKRWEVETSGGESGFMKSKHLKKKCVFPGSSAPGALLLNQDSCNGLTQGKYKGADLWLQCSGPGKPSPTDWSYVNKLNCASTVLLAIDFENEGGASAITFADVDCARTFANANSWQWEEWSKWKLGKSAESYAKSLDRVAHRNKYYLETFPKGEAGRQSAGINFVSRHNPHVRRSEQKYAVFQMESIGTGQLGGEISRRTGEFVWQFPHPGRGQGLFGKSPGQCVPLKSHQEVCEAYRGLVTTTAHELKRLIADAHERRKKVQDQNQF